MRSKSRGDNSFIVRASKSPLERDIVFFPSLPPPTRDIKRKTYDKMPTKRKLEVGETIRKNKGGRFLGCIKREKRFRRLLLQYSIEMGSREKNSRLLSRHFTYVLKKFTIQDRDTCRWGGVSYEEKLFYFFFRNSKKSPAKNSSSIKNFCRFCKGEAG